jgi:signal transduction histidine kinase
LNRELEDRVKARTQELEKALAYRDRLVSVVSHELRTPLGSMMLNQRLLQNAAAEGFPDATGLRRTIDVLSRQLDRLRDLVDDLLDTRRLASERMLLNKVPVDLRVIVTETLEEMAPQLSATGAKMAVVIGEGLRGTWDRHRIQQVLTNLISNALKYGHEPFVLTATRTDGRAQIVVSDHGKGIPREHLERIFQAFERGDTKERAPGLGLGLFIAERIVRAHDGSIRVESVPWQETRFIVELPLS